MLSASEWLWMHRVGVFLMKWGTRRSTKGRLSAAANVYKRKGIVRPNNPTSFETLSYCIGGIGLHELALASLIRRMHGIGLWFAVVSSRGRTNSYILDFDAQITDLDPGFGLPNLSFGHPNSEVGHPNPAY